jgi:hypothetical protein
MLSFWAEPTSKSAAGYEILDGDLGKLCARHNIPAPPRGWWAKKAAGKRVKQEPLPPLAAWHPSMITIEDQQQAKVAAPAECAAGDRV